VKTLSGEREIIFTLKMCQKHGKGNGHILEAIVPKKSDFDIKIMIAVGLLRWMMDYQREEIQLLLQARGVDISTGEISTLSERFLLSFYCIQKRHTADLRSAVSQYVLHLDGTGEAGKEIVFMAKEGKSGITIDARSMPSESVGYIVPFLKDVKEKMGDPLAIVRDMSESIHMAASEVFLGILQLICHYHFVRALGDTVFSDYIEFRNLVVKTKALASVSKIRADAGGFGMRRAEALWVGVASEYISYPRELRSKFPFALPYVEVVGRCMEVRGLAGRIVTWNMSNNVYCAPLMELCVALDTVTKNEDVKTGYCAFQKLWEWFELVRNALRVSRDMNSDTTKEPVSVDNIRKDFVSAINEVSYQGDKCDEYLKRKSLIFKKYADSHIDELVAPVIDCDGKNVDVVRHNGVEEIGHRWSRMHIRRRTGRSQTSAEMAMYGPLLAVLSNIENEAYIEKLLNKVDFAGEISSVSKKELEEARKLIRPYAKHHFISNDHERKSILHKLVDMMEKEANVEEHLEEWLSCVQVRNPTLD
jgi:hypothetical protein